MNSKKDVQPEHAYTTPSVRGNGNSGGRPLSREAFAQQFRESFRTFWLVAVGILRDREVAEDAVQEAAVVALGKLDQFEPGTNFRAWMGRIVRYVALNMARKESKRRTSPGHAEVLDSQPASDETAHTSDWEGQSGSDRGVSFDVILASALDGLGEIARACLLLRIVEELNYTEISSLLDIPEGTAMSHVHRARAHLRTRLADMSPETAPKRNKDVPPK